MELFRQTSATSCCGTAPDCTTAGGCWWRGQLVRHDSTTSTTSGCITSTISAETFSPSVVVFARDLHQTIFFRARFQAGLLNWKNLAASELPKKCSKSQHSQNKIPESRDEWTQKFPTKCTCFRELTSPTNTEGNKQTTIVLLESTRRKTLHTRPQNSRARSEHTVKRTLLFSTHNSIWGGWVGGGLCFHSRIFTPLCDRTSEG